MKKKCFTLVRNFKLHIQSQTLSTRYSVNKPPVRNPGSKNDVSKSERLVFGNFDVDGHNSALIPIG